MKKTSPLILLSLITLITITSFSQKKGDSLAPGKIENTLKSVSLFKDTVGIDSQQLFADFEKVNKAISAIGYPDAGYQIWEVQDKNAGFRYMIEGYWPDVETYRKIHGHELYIKATAEESVSWKALKQTWYNKFDMVK